MDNRLQSYKKRGIFPVKPVQANDKICALCKMYVRVSPESHSARTLSDFLCIIVVEKPQTRFA